MLLNGQERIVLLNTMPQEGNLITMKLVSELRSALSLDADELSHLGVKTANQQIPWEQLAALKEKEIAFSEITTGLIVEALKALDKASRLTVQHLTVYEKFTAAT